MNDSDIKPILYLFKSSFVDPQHRDERFFCPYCTQVEGMMSIFPLIRQEIDVKYVGFDKPRGELKVLCGESNQSCPQLVFPNGDDEISSTYSVSGVGNVRRTEKTLNILDYFSEKFNLAKRH